MARPTFGPRAGIVETERAAGNVAGQQQIGTKFLGRAAEQQITGFFRNGVFRRERHIDLRAGTIQSHLGRRFDIIAFEIAFPDEFENCRPQVAVRNHRLAANPPPVDGHTRDSFVVDVNLFDVTANPNIDVILLSVLAP